MANEQQKTLTENTSLKGSSIGADKNIGSKSARVAQNHAEAKAIGEQFKDIKSNVALTGVDTRTKESKNTTPEEEAEAGIKTFFFRHESPVYYITQNVSIRAVKHMYKTDDPLVIAYLSNHKQVGIDIFLDKLPEEILKAKKDYQADMLLNQQAFFADKEIE